MTESEMHVSSQQPAGESYEEKLAKLQGIISRLDRSETPLDRLAEDVKQGARLIKELEKTLKDVEDEVKDAFADLEHSRQPKAESEESISPF